MPQKPESDKDKQQRHKLFDDSMQQAYQKVSGEMPGVKKVSVSPSGGSILSKMFMPRGAYAVTNPFTGNITYNPDVMAGLSRDEMENVLAHEMTHVKQTQNTPWWKTAMEIPASLFGIDEKVPEGADSTHNDPYYWRPREMEAFQAERDRAERLKLPYFRDPISGMGDIDLRAPVSPSSEMLKKRGMK